MTWPRVFWPSGATSLAERRHLLKRDGPRLRVLLSNPFNPAMAPMEMEAVLDSGASCICVSRRLVKELGLTRTSPTRLVAVGSDHPAGKYAATVGVPELEFEKFLPVVAPDRYHSAPSVLLGRTFLEFFDFSYNGLEGTFTFHNASGQPTSHPDEFEEG